MAQMWMAVLVAPALMIVALALHHLEGTLDRYKRPRDASSHIPGEPLQRRPLDNLGPTPPSPRRPPRAAPTLP